MRVLVALGGNALQKRGEPMTVANQRANVAAACAALAPVALEHELVISHGNGPQVGLLALQASAFDEGSPYPFDVLGAQTEGMIGYLIEQELGNLLPFEKPLATILTMTEVDPGDPAFDDPTKFVGPVYSRDEAHRLAAERGWVVKPDGDAWRRVVPSPVPLRIFEQRPVEWLLARGCVVVCAGGGGIPTMYRPGTRTLVGVEAVIDTWVPAVPLRMCDRSLSAPMTASLPVVRAKSAAASTFGPIEPAGNQRRPSSSGWAARIGRWCAVPQSTYTASVSVAMTRASA